MAAVLHNPVIQNLLHNILHQVEKNDFDIEQVKTRIRQLYELYFGIFESVHHKYSEVIEELDSNELVKDFGRNSFENINRALDAENRILIGQRSVSFMKDSTKCPERKMLDRLSLFRR
jgi:hypothetical protein